LVSEVGNRSHSHDIWVTVMVGILSILAFETGWDLLYFVNYGLTALAHRGGDTKLVCWKHGDNIACGDGESSAGGLENSELVVAAWLNEKQLSSYTVEGRSSITVSDRPSKYLVELVEAVERALNSRKPHLELSKQLSVFTEEDVPSFATLTTRGELVVWRSSTGLTPLSIGGYGFDMVVASSETSAIEILDADTRKHLSPSEGAYISRRQVRLFKSGESLRCRLCLFELLYTARHDSTVDGVSAYEFRKHLGRELGKYLNSAVDVVSGVPETALPYAIGLSEVVRAPYELGFIGTAQRSRSMLKEGVREKLISIHLKLNPVKSVFRGKRVAVVDDSMVTGSTLKTVAQILRYRVGARELHVLLASPKLVGACPYGVVKLDPSSLISAQLDCSTIEKYLDVDSVSWLKERDIESAALRFGTRFCCACFGRDIVGGR